MTFLMFMGVWVWGEELCVLRGARAGWKGRVVVQRQLDLSWS